MRNALESSSAAFCFLREYAKLYDDGVFVYLIKNNKLKKEKLNIVGHYNNSYVTDNNFAKNDFLVLDNIENIDPNTNLKIKIIDNKSEIL